MERVNLNVPSEVRKRLKRVARDLGTTEAEAARSLLVDALDRREREAFYARAAAAQTPELRARQLEVLAAMERLRGPAR